MIEVNLELLEGYYVKKIGDAYYFYHDVFMEITTLVLGKDYPIETIKYADFGFLIGSKLGKCSDSNDPCIINLSAMHMPILLDRYLNEIVGERSMEVVQNPCR